MTAPTPGGTINIVDPSPLNWLFITWNTMEEPVRTDEEGRIVLALAESARWADRQTFELTLRKGIRFQDGEPFNAEAVKYKINRDLTLNGSMRVGEVNSIQGV